MKSKFNKSWNVSKQPRKQRKFLANAPNHIKRKLMGCSLDKKLREKHGRRNIEVVKGDEVKIMRGKFSGKQGKVGIVDVKNARIQIDGVQRMKTGGEKLVTWFHPSKVKIIILNDKDGRRFGNKKTAPKSVHQGGARTSSRPPAQMTSAVADKVGKEVKDEKKEVKVEEKPEVKKAETKKKTEASARSTPESLNKGAKK